MRTLSPIRWIPSNANPVTRDGLAAVVYLYESANGKPHAVAYRGKANKPAFHFSFRDHVRRAESVDKFFAEVKAMDDYRAKQKAEAAAKRAAGHGAMVGTIFYTSWGYDQTNVDFFEVVKVTPGSITVWQICQDTIETHFMAGTTKPRPGQFRASEKEIRCMFTGHGFSVKGHALSVWDGKPKSCSWYA